MGALPKSSEYCGPIKKKSYSYVSGIIGIAYNPFLSEDIRDCFFDYEQAVLLRFWTSRIVTIKSVNNPQAKLGLVLEEEVTAPSVPKSDKRVEFGLGFSDALMRTSLMAVWELMRPSWCPSPNADSILRATQDVQRELSNFSRQLKLKPGIDNDHRVIAAMSNDLWIRAMEVTGENTRRKNSLETRAHLEAMVLRTKPEANQWLHLNPRVAALGADAFEQGPVMITKIHAYLLKEVNLAENAGEKTAEFVNRMCQITLETFWTQEVKRQEGFARTDSMLEGLGAGWTAFPSWQKSTRKSRIT